MNKKNKFLLLLSILTIKLGYTQSQGIDIPNIMTALHSDTSSSVRYYPYSTSTSLNKHFIVRALVLDGYGNYNSINNKIIIKAYLTNNNIPFHYLGSLHSGIITQASRSIPLQVEKINLNILSSGDSLPEFAIINHCWYENNEDEVNFIYSYTLGQSLQAGILNTKIQHKFGNIGGYEKSKGIYLIDIDKNGNATNQIPKIKSIELNGNGKCGIIYALSWKKKLIPTSSSNMQLKKIIKRKIH